MTLLTLAALAFALAARQSENQIVVIPVPAVEQPTIQDPAGLSKPPLGPILTLS